jgi:acetate kinase
VGVLVINCGSSMLKFQLIDTPARPSDTQPEQRMAYGAIAAIGHQATLHFVANGTTYQDSINIVDHKAASRRLLDWLASVGLLEAGDVVAISVPIWTGVS